MGAAGRDFHNFNTCYRDKEEFEVVAFTAEQIPDIDGRKYPAELAGKLYPNGIDIHPESELSELIKKFDVDEVVFAYSDVTYKYVMNRSAIANSLGADFVLLGAKKTMIKSTKPVISICAVRTGCGKSQTTRFVAEILKKMGKKVVAIRHPMPYGDLASQKVQRFASYDDLNLHKCTIEEREEYEPHIDQGTIVYAGVDYEAILRSAETEADVILWDGGNNDLPFYNSDLKIVVADPHRPGHEENYYPGEANLRMADVVVINKMDSADPENITILKNNIKRLAPNAIVIEADSEITLENGLENEIKDKNVLVVEDGPTLTHGEMKYGAGMVAAKKFGVKSVIDPRPWTVGKITETYKKYPGIGTLLPAMGYGDEQVKDLEETMNKVECEAIISGTPIDIKRIVNVNKPIYRVHYGLKERGESIGILEKKIKEVAK